MFFHGVTLLVIGALTRVTSAEECNGFKEYCEKRYSELTYTGAHDSAFVRTSAFNSPFGNQYYDVTTQLSSGIRMLQAQVHPSPNGSTSASGIELCHTACNYPGSDFGAVESYLTAIKNWIAKNPKEVITILWVNSGSFDPTVWASAYQSTGLDKFVYTPPDSSNGVLALDDWPTLGDMISNNTRIVNFLSTTADFSKVPYLLDEFSNVWETGYDVASATGFTCDLDRPSRHEISNDQKLYLINHFLDYDMGNSILMPNVTYASVTNSVSELPGSLSAQVASCKNTHGRAPNFMLVDFFDQGWNAAVANAAIANNVTFQPVAGFPGAYAVPGSVNYVSAIPGSTLGSTQQGHSSVGSVLGGAMNSILKSASKGSHTSGAPSSLTKTTVPVNVVKGLVMLGTGILAVRPVL